MNRRKIFLLIFIMATIVISVGGITLYSVYRLAEIPPPFFKAGLFSGLSALVLISLGAVFFYRIGNPLIRHMEESEARLSGVLETAADGIIALTEQGDITERKRAEEMLRQREEEFRLAFENAPMGMVTIGLNYRFLRANHAFCEMIGYSEAELQEMTFADITHPDDLETSLAWAQKVKNGELSGYVIEKRYVRKDGTDLYCSARCNMVHDALGAPLMAIIHIDDRTEQLKSESELRALRNRLAHVARLNTLGEMTTGIAHEINQPLAAIATYAQACRELIGSDKPDYAEVALTLDKISTQALRAGEVIHKLRRSIKNSNGEYKHLDCNELINEVVKLAEVDLRHHEIAIQLELTPGLPPIVADPVQIQKVVLNLIRNAMEAMENSLQDHKVVTLRTRLHGNNRIEVAVTDRGVGLTEEAAEQVFYPFFTTKSSGTGLGLSSSHSIIAAHGGQLSFVRNPEGGTTFHFTLPVASKNRYGKGGERIDAKGL